MADKTFEGKVAAVAQVTTVQVTAYDVATTYIIKVGGVTLVSLLGDTDADTTATNIDAAWNLLTHPYAAGITSSVATDTVTFTADVAEVPFTVVPSVSGGTGTIGAATEVTAPDGPHTWDTPENWSDEALPVNNDDIYLRDSAINIMWGLQGLTTTGHVLHCHQTFTGLLGLDPSGFATTADGETVDTAAIEYRDVYMQLDCATINIGDHVGPGDPGGSRRLMIDNDRASASQTNVIKSNTSGFISGRPPIMLLAAHASAHVDVRSGKVGIGVAAAGETATVGTVTVQDGEVYTGPGVTITNVAQFSGSSQIQIGIATLTLARVYGGTVDLSGDQAITTLDVYGGVVNANSTGTITTLNVRGGRTDLSKSGEARTITTVNLYANTGGRLIVDPDVVTLTNDLIPDAAGVIDMSVAG